MARSVLAIPTDCGPNFEQMSWMILETPEQIVGGSYDGIAWTWRLRDDAGDERPLRFQVTGTAMSMAASALSPRGLRARACAGRSEVETVLGWDTPPERIELGSLGIRTWGGVEQLNL
jgi:hypothetical protein